MKHKRNKENTYLHILPRPSGSIFSVWLIEFTVLIFMLKVISEFLLVCC